MGHKENAVDREIIKFLNDNGIPNWRNQVIEGWYRPNKKVKEYWIKQGTDGLSDRSALLPDGRTLYIEEKRKLGGKQEKTQIDFERECIKRNVPYVLARSAKDVSNYLKILFMGTEFEKEINYL